MPVFPSHLLADLAPHAQHIRALHIKSRYGGGRTDEAMIAAYEILLPFLEAFPDLTHLAFARVGFIFGYLYSHLDVRRLQPHLRTYPSVASLDLGPIGPTGMGVLKINVLFPCLQTFAVADIESPARSAPAGTVFSKLEHFSVTEGISTCVNCFLILMPKLTSFKLQRLSFSQGASGESMHAVTQRTFTAMADNGVRLEHFALLNPTNRGCEARTYHMRFKFKPGSCGGCWRTGVLPGCAVWNSRLPWIPSGLLKGISIHQLSYSELSSQNQH
jgi:hypothetical protein